jgi:hypothetical protein
VVHGATDATGTAIKRDPVTEGDLLATLYAALGIDPRATNPCGIHKIPLVPEGARPVKALL